MAANNLKNFVKSQDSERNRFISENKASIEKGQIGYDNPRDNIDPQIHTNSLATEQIVAKKSIPVMNPEKAVVLDGSLLINRTTDIGNSAPLQVRNVSPSTHPNIGEWAADFGTTTSTNNAFVAVRNNSNQAMIFGIRGSQPFVQGYGASAFRVEQAGGSLGNMEVNNVEAGNITANNFIVNTGGTLNLTNIPASSSSIRANSTNETPLTSWVQDGATGNYEADRPPYGWLKVEIDETTKYIPVWD